MKKQMKQSKLVFLTSVASVLLLLIVGTFLFWDAQLNKEITQANQDRMDLNENANRFMNGSAYLTDEVRAYAATGDTVHYDNYWNEINNLKNRDIGVKNMQEIGITKEEQAKIDAMYALSNELVPLEEQAMTNTAAGNLQNALDYVYGADYETAIAHINQLKSDFTTMLINRTNAQIAELSATQDILQITNIITLSMIILMQIFNFRLILKRVVRPIIAVQKEMQEIASGNLSSHFALEANSSEIGMLIHSIHSTKASLKQYIFDISQKLEEMSNGNFALAMELDYIGDFHPIQLAIEEIIDSLNNAMHQIDETASQVSSGAEQVSAGSQALAQGATEQASSVEELSATIADLTMQVRQNAAHAETAKTQSERARSEVASSNAQMQEMISAMNRISSKSEEISKIIKTIEDIAFQTNILALNAAVEAARAGNAGKGFAVVADEVRNLAGKSAEAAKSTTELIHQTLDAVESGTRIADGTAAAMLRVVEGSDAVTSLVLDIASASGEQSGALSQVSAGVDQISSVVQTNSATAEQSAAAAEQLSGQAQVLKNLVDRFHLRNLEYVHR